MKEFMELVRRIWVSQGFIETAGPMIESSFSEVLGYKSNDADIKKLAVRSGYVISEEAKGYLSVAVPPYRYDFFHFGLPAHHLEF